jgi:hypothetical protein
VIISGIGSQVKREAAPNEIRDPLRWVTIEIERVFSLVSNQSWLRTRIQTARREAQAASMAALQDFMRSAKIDSAGRVVNHVGTAHLILCKPERAFRKAAHSVGLIQRAAVDGTRSVREYPVMEFQIPWGHPALENVDAQKLFCVTAGVVMQRYFPSERWMVVLEAER